jgi:hypothetical protein
MVISPKAKVDAPLSINKGRYKKESRKKNLGICSLIPSTHELGICKSFGRGIWMK